MRINYLLLVKENEQPKKESLDSLKVNCIEGDNLTIVTVTSTEETAINNVIKNSEGYTHFCFLQNGSNLLADYRSIIESYAMDPAAIILPLVEYCVEENGTPQFKGFLNNCIWKPYLAEEVGMLDLNLALRQIDMTLYGALIPLFVGQQYEFNGNIKYYSHFEYLNRVVSKDVSVLGAPKCIVRCPIDYELKNVSKEEKIKFFKAAQQDIKHEGSAV